MNKQNIVTVISNTFICNIFINIQQNYYTMIHGYDNQLIIISALTIMSCCSITPGGWAATAL